MSKRITIRVTLKGELVSENSTRDYAFPNKERRRASEIIKSSLYGYPIEAVNFVGSRAVVTLKGVESTFRNAIYGRKGPIEKTLVEELESNYGDVAADTWMEGDIFINKDEELFLTLEKIEFTICEKSVWDYNTQ